MTVAYRPVQWNRAKLVYDVVLAAAAVAYILIFLAVAPAFQDVTRPLDDAILRMRAFGTCAFLMLSFVLAIGPLARLDPRFLPLLYNRRHFGVMTAVVAAVHASHVLGWYFAFSPTDPYVALLGANTSFDRLSGFPFEIFGLAALLVLAVMAATSHDFWLHFLGPPVWKAIHMAVYGAYAAVVAHVALGALQATTNPLLAVVVTGAAAGVVGLHLAADAVARREARAAAEPVAGANPAEAAPAGWIAVGAAAAIPDGRAVVVPIGDREAAVFRDGNRIAAMSNACAHQNGPLGEGRIVDGCVTCPWHGFQYRLEDGSSPPPFTERVPTYRLKLVGGALFLDPRPLPAGTPVPPVILGEA